MHPEKSGDYVKKRKFQKGFFLYNRTMYIETERLIIRDFTASDVDDFAHLVADEEVMRFSLKGPLSKEEAKEYFQRRILGHYEEHGFGVWAVLHREKLIGFAGLISQTIDEEKWVELAYRFTPKFWGKGFATEAAMAICQYAFETLGLKQLISIIDPKNTPSIKLASRVGMNFWKEAVFHGFHVRIYVLKQVAVVPYQKSWHEDYKSEKEKLEKAFHGLGIAFEHIGSTSIPGCYAKPIIDILGMTPDILEVDRFNEALAKLEYNALGENGMRQRRFFIRRGSSPVNLHIFEETDPEVQRHLRFRDYLRSHPDKMIEYSQLKESLARQMPHHIYQYTLKKEKFVKSIDFLAASAASPIVNGQETPKRKRWTQDQILKAMEANSHLHMTYYPKYIPSMEIIFEFDATVVQSQISDDTFNYVLSAHFTENNADWRIAHIINHYKKKSLPFSWWVGPSDTPENLSDLLNQHGLRFKEDNVGMYLVLDHFHPPATSPLFFQRVDSAEQMKDFAHVILEFGLDPKIHELIYSQLPPVLYRGAAPFQFYVGYLDGVPVATGSLVLHANVAGIYYVITSSSHRKKGFGTAMTEHLLEQAKAKKYSISTLQALAEGKGLYERLGFKTLCSFKEYSH